MEPETSLLDVTLTAHRSLSPKALRRLLLAFAALSLAVSLPFAALGAWPVVGFMGLDVLLVYVAFRANSRAAKSTERVFVSPLELRLAKISTTGSSKEWKFHPWWTRLERETDEEFGLRKLAWVSHGTAVEIAACLGPAEKEEFARVLTRAMADARRGRRF
jgi:uncharacterized membrane protein